MIGCNPMESRLLRISSTDRSAGSVSRYDMTYASNSSDLQEIKKISLKSALIPNTQYNVNSNTNTFFFANSQTAQVAYTIPVGQYTTTTLMAAVVLAVSSVISGSITLVQSALTGRITLAINSGTFNMTPGSHFQINLLLGFKSGSFSSVTSLVADSLPNLSGLKIVYIASRSLSNSLSMICSEELKSTTFSNIPITVPYGSINSFEQDEMTSDFVVYHSRKNISTIDIKLLDENFNVIDLGGLDWSMVFRVYH